MGSIGCRTPFWASTKQQLKLLPYKPVGWAVTSTTDMNYNWPIHVVVGLGLQWQYRGGGGPVPWRPAQATVVSWRVGSFGSGSLNLLVSSCTRFGSSRHPGGSCHDHDSSRWFTCRVPMWIHWCWYWWRCTCWGGPSAESVDAHLAMYTVARCCYMCIDQSALRPHLLSRIPQIHCHHTKKLHRVRLSDRNVFIGRSSCEQQNNKRLLRLEDTSWPDGSQQ